jgi:tetratricopeptide (TPR) repeat protein
MAGHHFVSYSSADARDFAFQLHDALEAGPPHVPAWLDRRDITPGQDWDAEIEQAIRTCGSLLFVMSRDSVEDQSVCKHEWTRALRYKKPIVPLLYQRGTVPPFRLENRQHIDFTGSFDQALAKLRNHLGWLASPAGVLRALEDRLADAKRDLRRVDGPEQEARIRSDIDQLEKEIESQRRIVADPEGAKKRTEEIIARGLEQERQPSQPVGGVSRIKFLNPPPAIAPSHFQNRHVETRLIGDFLKDESKRLITVVGRAGIRKTATVCRILKALERGSLPDDLGPLAVDGIVYLSALGSRRVTAPNLYEDLLKLLPDELAGRAEAIVRDLKAAPQAKMWALLEAFSGGPTVVLLDNFEDLVDPATHAITDAELDEALRALLTLPHHGIKVILTTRIAPRALVLIQPGRQMRLDLDDGLESPYAENILREMDVDGKLGLKTAPAELLALARERTRGFPRALEALFAILSADRDTTLEEVLARASGLLPENVIEALVGEAFSRLDPIQERVMQALAVYGRPVPPAAVDYLLQPHQPGVDSSPVLSRLVNMHFARKELGRYYLHPVDREFALSRLVPGEASDRRADPPTFTRYGLCHRAAEYFEEARLPRANWKTIEDLSPQLAEFDLHCEGRDYETAAELLAEISFDYLMLWGWNRLVVGLNERLLSKLDDPRLKSRILTNQGLASSALGQAKRAIVYHEQALVIDREIGDRRGEGADLGNLGIAYADLVQVERAIDYYEQQLVIVREIGDRRGEGNALGNLGIAYADLGQVERAIKFQEQSLAMAREMGYRVGEGECLLGLSRLSIDGGRPGDAIEQAINAVEVATETGTPDLMSRGNESLALARLSDGDLPGARAAAQAAREHDVPLNNHNVLALLGLIAVRQDDGVAAAEAFQATIAHADMMLDRCGKNYDALDAKGVALAGLAVLEGGQRQAEAIAAFQAARAITKAPGIVGRVRRLLDLLAPANAAGVLAGVRAAVDSGNDTEYK